MPELAALFDVAKWADCINILHTDGDVSAILDDILNMHIDVLNCQAIGGMADLKNGQTIRGVRIWIEPEKDFVYRGYVPLEGEAREVATH